MLISIYGHNVVSHTTRPITWPSSVLQVSMYGYFKSSWHTHDLSCDYDVIILKNYYILNSWALILTNDSSFERYDWVEFNFFSFKSSSHTHDLSRDYDVIILKKYYILNSWGLIWTNDSSFERYDWVEFNFFIFKSSSHTHDPSCDCDVI